MRKMRLDFTSGEDRSQLIARLIPGVSVFLVVMVFVGILGVSGVLSAVSYIGRGQVGVIVNNWQGGKAQGAIIVRLENGIVTHLPYGLTQVYTLDRTMQEINMLANPNHSKPVGVSNVVVKTRDGSNVSVEIRALYKINPTAAEQVLNVVGSGEEFQLKKDSLLVAYIRSMARDELGRLSINEVSNKEMLDRAMDRTLQRVNQQLELYGIEVTSLAALNPDFEAKYDELIKQRKEAEQVFRNQESAQNKALAEQSREENRASREKQTTLIEVRGQLAKQIIAASAEADRLRITGEARAYQMIKQGEELYAQAIAEASAIATEGRSRAQGIQALSDAYREGGLALVREALAQKYLTTHITGRPYSYSGVIERLQLENTSELLPLFESINESKTPYSVPPGVTTETEGGE